MAITKSAKARIRRNARRNVINKSRMSQSRTAVKKVEEAIKAGNYTAAHAALKAAQPLIHKTGSKDIVHKKNASRKISRLSARVKALKK